MKRIAPESAIASTLRRELSGSRDPVRVVDYGAGAPNLTLNAKLRSSSPFDEQPRTGSLVDLASSMAQRLLAACVARGDSKDGPRYWRSSVTTRALRPVRLNSGPIR